MIPVAAIFEVGNKLIDRLWPDPTKAAEAKLELLKLQEAGELERITGQLEINKIEAASPNWLIAGARPAVMWICAFGLAYAAILEPIARFAAKVLFGYVGEFPALDTTLTMQILFGILGLGAYRTAEKIKGAEGNR